MRQECVTVDCQSLIGAVESVTYCIIHPQPTLPLQQLQSQMGWATVRHGAEEETPGSTTGASGIKHLEKQQCQWLMVSCRQGLLEESALAEQMRVELVQ